MGRPVSCPVNHRPREAAALVAASAAGPAFSGGNGGEHVPVEQHQCIGRQARPPGVSSPVFVWCSRRGREGQGERARERGVVLEKSAAARPSLPWSVHPLIDRKFLCLTLSVCPAVFIAGLNGEVVPVVLCVSNFQNVVLRRCSVFPRRGVRVCSCFFYRRTSEIYHMLIRQRFAGHPAGKYTLT